MYAFNITGEVDHMLRGHDLALSDGRWVSTPVDGVILELKFTELYPGWVRDLVQMFGLRALLDEALGQEAEAQSALVRAVSVSQPGGAVRLLADLGPELAGVLNRLDVQGEKLAHVAAILAAIGDPSSAEEPDPGDLQAVGVIDLPGVDPLTKRETDVLGLLERRYSNKEIAAELLIAPETVKKHSINLYRKLNVSGRREAVEKAEALGYLNGTPPTPPSNP